MLTLVMLALFPIAAQHGYVLFHLACCLGVCRTPGHVHRLTITSWQHVSTSPEVSSSCEMGICWQNMVNIQINNQILKLLTSVLRKSHNLFSLRRRKNRPHYDM